MGWKRANRDKKLMTSNDKYPKDPKMHETEPQEHDTWANMMLRYAKYRQTQEHKARTTSQEHECKTCGNHF